MPRNACVIQITPVRLTRTSANDASVVRKIYLSIDPMRYRTIPTKTPTQSPEFPAVRPIPKRDPQGRAAISSASLRSHYHPFDLSTKWLPHGTLSIWLVFPLLWPAGHGRRLAFAGSVPHSAESPLNRRSGPALGQGR